MLFRSQARELEARGIMLEPDCGFQMCMFDEADLGAMTKAMRDMSAFRCSVMVDVGPDLTLWPCFPLRGLMDARLDQYSTYQAIVVDFLSRLTPLQRLGSRPECADCRHIHRAQCAGGCLSYRIRQMDEQG